MRKTIKQVRRDAKHLFRLCLVNGSLMTIASGW